MPTGFEATESDFIQKHSAELIKDPKIGRVTRVYEHLSPNDDSNFEVDVSLDGGSSEERAKPYNPSWSGQQAPPMVGDKVIVNYLAGEKNRPVITDIAYTNEDRSPLARAGMFRDEFEAGESPVGSGNMHATRYTKYSDNPAQKQKTDLDPEETWIQFAKHPETPDPPKEDDVEMRFELYDSVTAEEDAAHILSEGTQIDGDNKKSLSSKMDFKAGTDRTEATDSNVKRTTALEHDIKNYIAKFEGLDTNTDNTTLVKHDTSAHTLITQGEDGSSSKVTTVEHDTEGHTVSVQASAPGTSYLLELDLDGETAILRNENTENGIKLDFSSGAFKLLDRNGYGIESDGSGNFTWHYESIDYKKGSTTSL